MGKGHSITYYVLCCAKSVLLSQFSYPNLSKISRYIRRIGKHQFFVLMRKQIFEFPFFQKNLKDIARWVDCEVLAPGWCDFLTAVDMK